MPCTTASPLLLIRPPIPPSAALLRCPPPRPLTLDCRRNLATPFRALSRAAHPAPSARCLVPALSSLCPASYVHRSVFSVQYLVFGVWCSVTITNPQRPSHGAQRQRPASRASVKRHHPASSVQRPAPTPTPGSTVQRQRTTPGTGLTSEPKTAPNQTPGPIVLPNIRPRLPASCPITPAAQQRDSSPPACRSTRPSISSATNSRATVSVGRSRSRIS